MLFECEAQDINGQRVPITRWLPKSAIPAELDERVAEAEAGLPITFSKRSKVREGYSRVHYVWRNTVLGGFE